jgi:hypothetical protein
LLARESPEAKPIRDGQARLPAKLARHSPEAKPMADRQGEAAKGTSGQALNKIVTRFYLSETDINYYGRAYQIF